jgi:hypothetical protein
MVSSEGYFGLGLAGFDGLSLPNILLRGQSILHPLFRFNYFAHKVS